MNRVRFVTILLTVALVSLVFPALVALAQGDEPPAPLPPLDIPTPDEILVPTTSALLAILAAVVASPVTSTITSILKVLINRLPDRPFLKNVKAADPRTINIAVAFVLIGLSWAFWALGLRAYFDSFVAFILSLAPVVIGTAINARSSQAWHSTVVHSIRPRRAEPKAA